MYATIKCSHLLTKHNPNISAYLKVDEMQETPVNLNKNNFRLAFTIENYFGDKERKNDPRYVKYFFRMAGKRKGKFYEKILTSYECTDEDYEEFNPIR